MKELVLGGVRSGKSALAERRAAESGLEVVYIATATVHDDEMAKRVARHKEGRPGHWRLVEEPLALADALQRYAAPERCLLVDCLTLWLSNLLCLPPQESEARFKSEREALLNVFDNLPGHIILVGNEVGFGVVPMGELSRRFCDEAGWLHQALAERCARVTLTAAGLPLVLKDV